MGTEHDDSVEPAFNEVITKAAPKTLMKTEEKKLIECKDWKGQLEQMFVEMERRKENS